MANKSEKKRTYTSRLLLIRKAERIASFARLILLVGNGLLLAYILTTILDKQTTLRIVLFVVCGFVEILLYISQKYLDKIRSENDFEIDNFEDTAKYKKKRTRPNGQIDENGEMNVNILLKRGSDEPMEDLEKLIGLASAKREAKELQLMLQYETKAGNQTRKKVCRHYAFLGNPGTGKTTVARIFTGILYQNGEIKKNKCLECTGNDLTGEYAGQTKTKVNAIYEKAKGGVLFIDEAYSLCRKGNDTMADEAVSQLLVHMESDPYTTIIFAGYTNNMMEFLNMNPGLASRVSQMIHFEDYTSDELVEICKKFCAAQNVFISDKAQDALKFVFEEKKTQTDSNFDFSNGRYARNCFDNIYRRHAINAYTIETSDPLFNTIVEKDVLDIKDELLALS